VTAELWKTFLLMIGSASTLSQIASAGILTAGVKMLAHPRSPSPARMSHERIKGQHSKASNGNF